MDQNIEWYGTGGDDAKLPQPCAMPSTLNAALGQRFMLDLYTANYTELSELTQTEAERTEPNQTELNQNEPNQTEPNHTELNRTEST